MITYKRTVLIIATVLGPIVILLLASFSTSNACAFANQQTEFIKDQTQLAIKAKDFEKSKYYAYKALKGINKTKDNFKNCGCENALKNISQAEQNLKEATRTSSFEDSKTFLEIALRGTLNSLVALEEFENKNQTENENTLLVLNTKQALYKQGVILEPKDKQLVEAMDKSLADFENSLDKVVQYADCADALSFISDIRDKTQKKLKQDWNTEAKIYYHKRVKEITNDALVRLEDCPVR